MRVVWASEESLSIQRLTDVLNEERYTAELMEQALASSSDRANALLHFAGRLDAEEAVALRKALDTMPPDRNSDPGTEPDRDTDLVLDTDH